MRTSPLVRGRAVTDAVGADAPQPYPESKWRRWLRAGWLAYWAVLTYLLLAPKVPRVPITISSKGLVVHAWTFGLLAYAAVLARRTAGRACTVRWAVVWGLIFTAYGGVAELIQPYTGRDCDIEDLLADFTGVLVVLTVATLRDRKRRTVQSA